MSDEAQLPAPADASVSPSASVSVVQRDPGLQPERTTLAWFRTSLASSVVSLLLLRGLDRADPELAGLAVASWALATGAYVAATLTHRRRVLGVREERYPRPGWAVLSLSASVMALAAGAIHLALQAP